jgi:hypothetical protein
MLFTEGMDEPLRGLVKAFNPNTLREATMDTQDMEDTFPNNTSEKKIIPQKFQLMKPP